MRAIGSAVIASLLAGSPVAPLVASEGPPQRAAPMIAKCTLTRLGNNLLLSARLQNLGKELIWVQINMRSTPAGSPTPITQLQIGTRIVSCDPPRPGISQSQLAMPNTCRESGGGLDFGVSLAPAPQRFPRFSFAKRAAGAAPPRSGAFENAVPCSPSTARAGGYYLVVPTRL
jgi:hypothetical protein